MTIIQVVALLISLTALFSYLNYRFIKLPTTIGVMLIALLFSLALVGLKELGYPINNFTAQVLGQIDFDATLLQGMLSFLLFAGALQINLNDLRSQRGTIITLSLVGS